MTFAPPGTSCDSPCGSDPPAHSQKDGTCAKRPYLDSPLNSSRPGVPVTVDKMRRQESASDKRCGRERSAKAGTGVDVEAVWTQVRQAGFGWSVSVNNERSVTGSRRQERLSNPQQVSFSLIRDGNTRSNSRMYEKPAMIHERDRKSTDPGKMLFRELARISDAIAVQRLFSAIGPPIDQVGVRPISFGGS